MKICKKITNQLVHLNIIKSDDKDIYEYGLFVIIFNSIIILSYILIGVILNQLIYSILFIIFYSPCRIAIGGAHCSTPKRCFLISNIYFLIRLLLYLLSTSYYLIFTLNIITFVTQLYRIENKKILTITSIIYLCLLIIPMMNIKIIINIAYLQNSLLKIFELYSHKQYLY